MPVSPRKLLVPVALVAVAFALAGCGAVGRVTSGDPGNGKKLFMTDCGGCHTLMDAKTTGTIGPNLDDAFASDKAQGFTQGNDQTIKDVIRGQIAYPEKPMPANLVTGSAAADIATYVAKCAAVVNCGVTANGAAPSSGAATTTPSTSSGAGSSSLAAGKAVFTSAGCSGCHTLKDAGATGNIGPNLDQLKPSKAAVQRQVTNGGAVMPSFKSKLSAQQIDAVAAYVSGVAGK